jgi:hypothetical protein
MGRDSEMAERKKPRSFVQATPDAIPYSDRKAMGNAPPQWRIEDIVYAQRRACEGASNDEIAKEMALPHHEVARVLNAEPKAARQQRANVRSPHMKPQRPRFF